MLRFIKLIITTHSIVLIHFKLPVFQWINRLVVVWTLQIILQYFTEGLITNPHDRVGYYELKVGRRGNYARFRASRRTEVEMSRATPVPTASPSPHPPPPTHVPQIANEMRNVKPCLFCVYKWLTISPLIKQSIHWHGNENTSMYTLPLCVFVLRI